MNRVWVVLSAVLWVAGASWGQAAKPADVEIPKAMADLAAKTRNALATIEFKIQDELYGSLTGRGVAICIGLGEGDKGVLITTDISPQFQATSIKSISVTVPGVDKPLTATYRSIDPESGIAFLDVTEPHKWQPVRQDKVDLSVGKQVFSVGLLDQALGFEPYLGLAYVSAKLRVPGPMIYVTGGSLTRVGSAVFTADGAFAGLVRQQLPSMILVPGQRDPIPTSPQRETQFFIPVDDFAHVLKSPPPPGKRLPWIGVLEFKPHPEDVLPLGYPAVRAVKVVPDSPAGKAGLKDNDTITGFNDQSLEKLPTPELTVQSFVRRLNRLALGEKISLTVLDASPAAGGKGRKLEMVVDSFPPMPIEAKKHNAMKELGMWVREKVMLDEVLDPTPAAKEKGLYVFIVDPRGPAAAAGLKADDWSLIVSVAGQPVTAVDRFKQVVAAELAKNPKNPITMMVRKGAVNESVSITPAQ